MKIFLDINNWDLFISIGLSIFNAILLTYISYKFFQIIQVSGYHLKSYFNWLKDTKAKYISRLFSLAFLSTASIVTMNVLFDKIYPNKLFAYISVVFYVYFTVIFTKNVYKAPQKQPLKYTRRMNRLITVSFIFYALFSFFAISVSYQFTEIFRFSVISLMPLLIPIVIPAVHYFNLPLENAIKMYYRKKAIKKLETMPNLIKIGITGSYAKTSTKEFLKTILAEKYQVCASPASFNTLTGISKTVLEHLKITDEVLIAEMGATDKRDIEKLMKMVKPTYSILTSVINQHLLTFKTFDNIKETKYELVKFSPKGSTIVFNCQNEVVEELYNRQTENLEKIAVKLDDKNYEYSACDITLTNTGTTFNVYYKGENIGEFSSKLLGKHNVENMLMAITIAYKLGLTTEQIKAGVMKCQQVKHRLELINTENGITIIDDSFNSNVDGTICATEIVKLFDNKRKIIMTPGIVELGDEEFKENYKFGKRIAKVFDICIIVNNVEKEAILKGLKEENFNEENIFTFETLAEAQQFISNTLTNGDLLLISNDLPDFYL